MMVGGDRCEYRPLAQSILPVRQLVHSAVLSRSAQLRDYGNRQFATSAETSTSVSDDVSFKFHDLALFDSLASTDGKLERCKQRYI